MKKDKKEHKKGAETTIGKIIYGFLLFMPLFAIGITCGYAMFNKNAYQSYADISSNTIININGNYNQTLLNNDYNYTFRYNGNNNTRIGCNVKNGQTNLYDVLDIDEDAVLIRAWNSSALPSGDFYVDITYLSNNQNSTLRYQISVGFQFTSVVDGNISYWGATPITFSDLNFSIFYMISEQGKLSDVFYYSVNKVTESPLFSWAQNSIVYTTLNNTCNTLSITTTFIPLIMSYWLIISVIYFLYDIALMLIWLLHNKIHELQESF